MAVLPDFSVELGLVDGAYLCIVGPCDSSCEHTIIPAIPIRAIPSWLHRRSSLHSWSDFQVTRPRNSGRKRRRTHEHAGILHPSLDQDQLMELTLQTSSFRFRGKSCCDDGPTMNVFQSLQNVNRSISMPCSGQLNVEYVKDGSLLLIRQKINGTEKNSQLRVWGGGRCMAADYCGAGAYKQVLILPSFPGSLKGDWTLRRAKAALCSMLSNSILTDGIHAWLPYKSHVSCEMIEHPFLAQHDSIPSITFPKFSLAEVSSIPSNVAVPIHELSQTGETKNSDLTNGRRNGATPHWATSIEKVLELKLWEKRRSHEKQSQSLWLQKNILQTSRKTAHDLANVQPSASSDLRLLRMKYRTRPTAVSSEDSRGLSLAIHFEIDIAFLPITKGVQDVADMFLHNLQLFFVPACKESVATQYVTCRTKAGLIPFLSRGDCVTVSSIVAIEGICVQSRKYDESTLAISIQALWGRAASPNPGTLPKCQFGVILGSIVLPIESLLVMGSLSTCMTIECRESAQEEGGMNLEATAIFECRKPHVIKLDVSKTTCDWTKIIEEFNSALQGTWNQVDWHHDGSSTADLIMFVSNEHEVSALEILMKKYIPDYALVIEGSS